MEAMAESEVDVAPAEESHTHLCWSCRDWWQHYAGDEGCVGVKERTCPVCEESGDPEPWFVGRGPVG